MAQLPLFSLTSNLLSMIIDNDSPFRKAYQWVKPILEANNDLHKLKETIELIQAVLLDAEKKQQDSAMVKIWIQRVNDVLYEADDFFDEVAADHLLKQHEEEGGVISKKVRRFLSTSNPIISNYFISKRVDGIRKRLDEISEDIAKFDFTRFGCEKQVSCLSKREETRPFVDPKVVVGRRDEKRVILEFISDESNVDQSVSILVIVGIGGMGKTTLAQLVYNDEEVQRSFANKWWACIYDQSDETKVLERIVKSISGQSHNPRDLKQTISESLRSSEKYLLVLDDVWDNNLGIWFDIVSLLSSGVKGSKIIVTTRFLSVARVMKKDRCRICTLNGLSDDESWELFKRIAFTEEQENDPRWTSLGREIVKKCANVPLAVKSIAGLLLQKSSMREWEAFKDDELSKIKLGDDSIMSALKLSYDHLPSNLKHCFAYCSLFPHECRISKEDLVCLWIAQGYVKPDDNATLEEVGYSYFMELFKRSFFQEVEEDEYGDIESCKMHGLIHDLAKEVAGVESLTLTTGWSQFHKNTRHLCIYSPISISGNIDANQVRSSFFNCRCSLSLSFLDDTATKFKLLRVLDLSYQEIKIVPSSIGGLKHLRYLDLSGNQFKNLPDSFTKLVNLITLNISSCSIEALPHDFRKCVNLRHLVNRRCNSLKHMPPRLDELTCLQRLSDFKVGKSTSSCSSLDVLSGLNLKGELHIKFDPQIDDWDNEDECWQLPTTMCELSVYFYPGMKIPHWGRQKANFPSLVSLFLYRSSTIKHLPPFRCLPYLKSLKLFDLYELEYVEEGEDGNGKCDQTPISLFFPCLEVLALVGLKNLKGWSRGCCPSFPLLSNLTIRDCQVLKPIPLSPHLLTLHVECVNEEVMLQLTSSSSSLKTIVIKNCSFLESFRGETLTSLQCLRLSMCNNLKNLYLAPWQLNVVEELSIHCCPELELWEEENKGVDWDSLPKLRELWLDEMGQVPHKLPDSLQQLRAIGELQIK